MNPNAREIIQLINIKLGGRRHKMIALPSESTIVHDSAKTMLHTWAGFGAVTVRVLGVFCSRILDQCWSYAACLPACQPGNVSIIFTTLSTRCSCAAITQCFPASTW